jgi:hypothetical protein
VYDTPGKGLAFHFDKCEATMAASGTMLHPALSSVMYLNSAAECAAPPLGATLVMEQRFDAAAGCGMPEPSRHDVLAWPTPNTLLVFDGALAHGVLDSASRGVRRTLLVNWWRTQPASVARATAAEYTSLHALAPPLPQSTEEAVLTASRVSIPVCELRTAQDCVDGPVPLEEALSLRGCGPEHTPAVALHHPDAVVWQVESQEADADAAGSDAAVEGAPARHVSLVAALIPDALAAAAGSSSDACSSSSSSGDEPEP